MPITKAAPKPISSLNGSRSAAEQWGQENGTWISEILGKHASFIAESGVVKYQALYDGFIESVEERDKNRGGGINNKLHLSLAPVIIDTITDYLVGTPPLYTVEDPQQPDEETKEADVVKEYRRELTAVLGGNGPRVLAECLRQGCISGYDSIIAWIDENGRLDFEEFPAQEVIPIYDTRGRLIMVLRKYAYQVVDEKTQQLTEKTRVEVYDDRYITYYIADELGAGFMLDEAEAETGNPVEHYAGRIPVAMFINGVPATYEDRIRRVGTSDLRVVASLIEDYAHKVSDKANTVEYLLDQYLLLVGVDTDEGEVLKMRKARALVLKGDKNISDAKFISQTQEDTAVENHLNRIRDSIFILTFTPRLSDLSGATATEVKLKYADLDIKAGKKENYFGRTVRDLIEIITGQLNAKRLKAKGVDNIYEVLTGQEAPPKSVELYDPAWVAVTFNRNLPQNYRELADIVKELAGVVPDSYLYELLWFIDDPVKALAEMKTQKKEDADTAAKASAAALYGTTGNFNDTTDNDTGSSNTGASQQ